MQEKKKSKRRKLSILDQLSLEAEKYHHLPIYVNQLTHEIDVIETETADDRKRGTQHRFKSFEEISGKIEKAP